MIALVRNGWCRRDGVLLVVGGRSSKMAMAFALGDASHHVPGGTSINHHVK